MTQLRIYKRAVVAFPPEDEITLSTFLTVTDELGKVIQEPPEFPLEKAQVVFNGADATISVPQKGAKHRRVCRLTQASLTEPHRAGDPIIVEGTAAELLRAGYDADQSRVKASIMSYETCATCR